MNTTDSDDSTIPEDHGLSAEGTSGILLEANPELARGRVLGGALASQRVDEFWRSTAAVLNCFGDGATKTAQGWKTAPAQSPPQLPPHSPPQALPDDSEDSVDVGPRRGRNAQERNARRPYRRNRYDDPPLWARRYEEQRLAIDRERASSLRRLVEIAERALQLMERRFP